MHPKYHKTSETDFETFKKSVIFWMSYFKIGTWEVGFEHNDSHPDNRATCCAELGARHVTFVLTKSKWAYKVTEAELRLLGFHEVVELLLMRLQTYACERNPVGDLNDIVHEIVHVLENSVFRMVEANFDCESTKLDNNKQTVNNRIFQ